MGRQAVLVAERFDAAEADRVGERMAARERARHAAHAAMLRDALELERLHRRAGMELGWTSEIALRLSCSEHRAAHLLSMAHELADLGAFEALETGVLTVEQSYAVLDLLGPLDDVLADRLWDRLHGRLAADAVQDSVLPPAELRRLLNRWIRQADPAGVEQRRKERAAHEAGVHLRDTGDGLADLSIHGLTALRARACVDAIRAHATRTGPEDTRSSGERHRDAAAALLTRGPLCPAAPNADIVEPAGVPAPTPADAHQSGCRCAPGELAPCGAQLVVHVPLPAALGDRHHVAVTDRGEAIDPELLTALLGNNPTLHRTWTHPDTAVPLGTDPQTWQPGKDDPLSLLLALLDLATGPPPPPAQRQPVHPGDHHAGQPPPERQSPGSYRPSARTTRHLKVRAPRCEWPGCGMPASHCDIDHDTAWPIGATCPCQLGPLCRHHHRVKQTGWTKTRHPDGTITWTSPTGSTWHTPAPHRAA